MLSCRSCQRSASPASQCCNIPSLTIMGWLRQASKLFQPYEPRRDLFAGASLLDQGPKQPPKKFQRTGNESHEAIHR